MKLRRKRKSWKRFHLPKIFCLLLCFCLAWGLHAAGRRVPLAVSPRENGGKSREGCPLWQFVPSWVIAGSEALGTEKLLYQYLPEESCLLEAPFLDQRKNFPTGCESVTAVMALSCFGLDITVEEFVESYLPMGSAPYPDGNGNLLSCDPRKAFPGDPRSETGWGCYPPVIVRAASDFLEDRNARDISVEAVCGESLSSLCGRTQKGQPVALWATIDMAEPQESDVLLLEDTGETFTWVYPMHCLLLLGKKGSLYYFNDPLRGKAVAYEASDVERAYQGLGMQAVVFSREKESSWDGSCSQDIRIPDTAAEK